MTRGADWLREERTDAATDKILEGAARAFAEFGPGSAGMADVARFSGCSRATVYRYFPTREDLHVAFVNREAIRIHERVRVEWERVADPEDVLVGTILAVLREVRRNPSLAPWFSTDGAGFASRVGGSSRVVRAIAEAFVERLPRAGGGSEPSSRWLVRIILSLLTMPGESETDEEEMLRRFVAPSILRR